MLPVRRFPAAIDERAAAFLAAFHLLVIVIREIRFHRAYSVIGITRDRERAPVVSLGITDQSVGGSSNVYV